jgi:uncharacterized damage-inducible protein DinB
MPFAGEPAADHSDAYTLAVDYLDWYGDVLLRRLEGLDAEQQTTSVVPSGWSALGMVKHSASVRRYWMRYVFAGEEVDFSWPGTEQQEWEIAEDDTSKRIQDYYRREHQNSLRTFRSTPPAAVSVRSYGDTGVRPTLAWVLMHLLQESARHSGHLDISRELTDGATQLDL